MSLVGVSTLMPGSVYNSHAYTVHMILQGIILLVLHGLLDQHLHVPVYCRLLGILLFLCLCSWAMSVMAPHPDSDSNTYAYAYPNDVIVRRVEQRLESIRIVIMPVVMVVMTRPVILIRRKPMMRVSVGMVIRVIARRITTLTYDCRINRLVRRMHRHWRMSMVMVMMNAVMMGRSMQRAKSRR